MSILSIHSNRRQETVSMPKIVLNNKTGPLFFKIQFRCEDKYSRTSETRTLKGNEKRVELAGNSSYRDKF